MTETGSSGAASTSTQPATPQFIQSSIPLPSKLDFKGNLAVNWKKFKRLWTNYEIASRLSTQSSNLRTATLLTCIGPDILEIYDGLPFGNEEEKTDIDKVIELLDVYFIGETNEIYEAYLFNQRVQEVGEIEYGPRLIRKGARLDVVKGYSVDINCQLTDSLAEVSLLQDVTKGGKTKQVTRVPDGNKVTQRGQIFTINNVSNSDGGKYKCKVKSWVLTTDSLCPVDYDLQGKIIDILIDPQTIAVREGESATLACKVKGNFFKSVEWFQDKVKVPLRYITYSNSGGYNISSIQLPAVSAAQAGSYECRTTVNISSFKPGGYKSKSAMLYLRGKIIDILIDPQTIAVREGESATFACKVKGNFFKSVEWFKDKVKVPLRYITYSNSWGYNISSIQLPAVSVAQAGSYECRTTVGIRFFKPGGYKSKSAMLYVRAFHFLAKKRKFQRQFVGDNMTINCKTSEEKVTSSLWVRKSLNPAKKVIPNGVTITQKGNRFYFKNLTQSDAGIYICKATLSQINKTIEEEITSLLVFKGGQKGPQAQVYPVVKEIVLGVDFNFSCQAAGDDVSIKWLRNGQPIPSTQTYSKPPKTIRGFTFNENILMLQKVSKMDDSNYTCVVRTTQNPGNSIRATAVLLVKASNKVATVVSIAFGILVTIGLFAGSLKCFFLLKKRKSSADNIQILSSEFVYHAFIIYSQEDSKWVTGKLLPCLEEKHNFKCCVHYRDFAPGKPFEESMAESVYTSHKVIAVMSRNFFKSNYCRYELNIAKYRLLNKGDDSLIIIRIDNEDCGKLPKELRKRNFIDFSDPYERPLWEQKLLRFLNVQWEINQDCAMELSCEIENTDNSSALLPRRGGRLNSEINAVDQNRRPVTETDRLSEEHETVL